MARASPRSRDIQVPGPSAVFWGYRGRTCTLVFSVSSLNLFVNVLLHLAFQDSCPGRLVEAGGFQDVSCVDPVVVAPAHDMFLEIMAELVFPDGDLRCRGQPERSSGSQKSTYTAIGCAVHTALGRSLGHLARVQAVVGRRSRVLVQGVWMTEARGSDVGNSNIETAIEGS